MLQVIGMRVTTGFGDPDLASCDLVNPTTLDPLPAQRSPRGPKDRPPAMQDRVTEGTGEALASPARLYSTIVPVWLATHRSPMVSKVTLVGPSTPLVTTASGRASPVAPGRYKVMDPGPVPTEPLPSAPTLATKIVPEAARAGRETFSGAAARRAGRLAPRRQPSRQPGR